MTTYIDTLLADGHDIRTQTGVFATGQIDGLYAPILRRGDDDDIAGADGSLGAQLPLAKYIISVEVWIGGTTTAELNTNLRSFVANMSGTNGLVTLTRHLDNGSGYDAHTAPGRFIGIQSFTLENHLQGHGDVQFYQLNGFWLDGSTRVLP